MVQPTRLALDLGTTAAKAALFDDSGRRFETRRVRLTLRHLDGGGVEQDPEEILDAARSLLSRTARSAPRSRGPLPCGIACQRSTVVLWERASGRPVGPAVSWLDRRASALAWRWEGRRPLVARRTGLRLSPHYGAAHLARLFSEDRSLARAARRGAIVAGPVASFVLARIAPGCEPACDPTLAQRTLLYDPRIGGWDRGLCALFGVPEACLPAVRPSTGRWADVSFSGRSIAVTALAGDQQAAAAAFDLGGRDARAMVHLGTGAFALWPAAKRLARPRGLLLSLRADEASRFYVEGPVNTAGSALDAVGGWIGRRRLRLELARCRPRRLERDGPVLVPAFAGLGAPHWDDAARPLLAGMRASDGPGEIAGAALAGIAHRIADIFEAGARTLADVTGGVILSGPLAEIPGFAALLADLLGRPVRIAREPEATLRGIARLAGRTPGRASIPGAPAGPEIRPRAAASDRAAARAGWRRALTASRTR